MSKRTLVNTASSAIDIILPYNFWRFLYFITGQDASRLKAWVEQFKQTGEIRFDTETHALIKHGIRSKMVTDAETLSLIKEVFQREDYLIDPHLAVALAAGLALRDELPKNGKLICLATAHPAKFTTVIKTALEQEELPEQAQHSSIEAAKTHFHNILLCEQPQLSSALVHALEQASRKA